MLDNFTMLTRGTDGPTREILHDSTVRRFLDDLGDAVFVIDAEGNVEWANRTAEILFDRSLESAIGMSALDLIHPEDLEFALRSLTSVQAKKRGHPIEVRLQTPSGWRLMELLGTPISWFKTGSVLLSLRDLTDRRRFELSHNEDSRFRTLVQNAAVLTMLVSAEGVIQSCSGALTRLLGHDSELVEGQPLEQLVVEEDRPAIHLALQRATRGALTANPVTVTVSLMRHGNDTAVPFELSFVNLVDDPTVGGFVVSGHDVTERRHLEEQLFYQAFHDSLTGLGNRALFHDRVEQALARADRTERQLALLFMDLDDFKRINDVYGHAAGDALLRQVAQRLLSCLRSTDLAARIGGDEFGVLVEDVIDPNAVTVLAKRVLGSCRAPFFLGQNAVSAEMSIGITYNTPGMSVEELLRNADRAMYSAKDHGKNRYEAFEGQETIDTATGSRR